MQNGKLTYCDAENAIKNGSYKFASDDELLEMRNACLNVCGPKHSAIQRIYKFGEMIQEELRSRDDRRRQHAGLPVISKPSENLGHQQAGPGTTRPDGSWNEARLLALVADRIEESLNLEYKAAPALSRDNRATVEITKDVSAMANSAGGILIYGMAQFQDASRCHLPERLHPVDRTQFSKEWLEHVIAQIRPRISDLKIHSVQLSSGINDVAYVLEIPQGGTAHQATDCRYYRRYNFESVRMVDHEIRDILNRKAHPLIIVGANLHVWPEPNKEGVCGRLIFDVHNESDVFARYLLLIANVPIKILGKPVTYEKATIDTDDGTAYKIVFTNHDAAPLFPRVRLSPWFDFRFVKSISPEPAKQSGDYRFLAFADSMPVQSGVFTEGNILRK